VTDRTGRTRGSAPTPVVGADPRVGPARPPRRVSPLARLRMAIGRNTRSVNATWGIYIKSLDTGEEVAIHPDRQMETMSTIKIPLMVEVFEQIKAGRFALSDKYTLEPADVQPGTGILQRMDPGAVITVKDLITMMIIVSDNTAAEVLYRMVGGPDAVNARLLALGLSETRALHVPSVWFQGLQAAESPEHFYREGKYRFGLSTAREMGRLLELMEQRALVDAPSSELMLQILRWQLYRARIPRYISGYQIAHKTGDFAPYVEDDVGVLEVDDRRIVVCIFTGNHFGAAEALENAIGLVAKDVADYFAYRP
jgi:beta-lactamase class A